MRSSLSFGTFVLHGNALKRHKQWITFRLCLYNIIILIAREARSRVISNLWENIFNKIKVSYPLKAEKLNIIYYTKCCQDPEDKGTPLIIHEATKYVFISSFYGKRAYILSWSLKIYNIEIIKEQFNFKRVFFYFKREKLSFNSVIFIQ